jgi:hypothetical protein
MLLDSQYIPNTVQHQQIWNGVEIVKTAFVPEIDDDDKGGYGVGRGYVFKILLLGVGVFSKPDNSYVELIKKMAYNRNFWSSSPRRITFTGLTTISAMGFWVKTCLT